jgi:hypothetical protein
MDFKFTDISSTFSDMVQNDIPKDIMSNTDKSGSQDQLFFDKLSAVIKRIESRDNEEPAIAQSQASIKTQDQSQAPVQTMQSGKKFESDEGMISSLKKLSCKKGFAFVSSLKNIFLALSKGELKNISIDSEGLAALKKMLMKAGFAESDIDDLLVELSQEFEGKDLTLDVLFAKLFDLEPDLESEPDMGQETFLEMSALPFLESILNSLGIPKDKIQEILTKADTGGNGISLDVMIEELSILQKQSFYSGNGFTTREGDDSSQLLLKQLGLEDGESKTSQFTINDLVSSLEKLRKDLSPQTMDDKLISNSDQKPDEIINALFKGLELKNKTEEGQVFEFSYGQVKNQLKNELVAGAGEINKKDLFSDSKNEKNLMDKKLNNAFKEMETFLDSKKGTTSDMNDQFKDTKEFLKQFKSRNTKASDQTLMSASDTKTNDLQSGLDILKTKPTLKNLPTYVTNQVSKSLVRAINQGENIIRIQLKPAELGRLMMTIDNSGNSMKVSIMTESQAAKDILAANIHEIKTVLSNSGVTLEEFEVDMNSNFRQSMSDAKNQAQNSGKRNKANGLAGSDNGEGMNDSNSLLNNLSHDGAMHFVA